MLGKDNSNSMLYSIEKNTKICYSMDRYVKGRNEPKFIIQSLR